MVKNVVAAVIHNVFPEPGSSGAVASGCRVDTDPARLEKVAYRTNPLAALHHGNHGVPGPWRVGQTLRILHVPRRSEQQFRSKIAIGAAALRLTGPRSPGLGADHWRDLDDESVDELGIIWRDLLEGRGDPKLGWSPTGELRPIELGSWRRAWDPDDVLGVS